MHVSSRILRRFFMSGTLWMSLLTGVLSLHAQQPPEDTPFHQVRQIMDAAPGVHPRLLLDDAGFRELRMRVRQEPRARELYQLLQHQAEAMLNVPPVQHIVTGRRLLSESRKAVRRILTLSLVYRLSGDARLRERATEEMLSAASFPDWNPSHFLDTAEMAFALAIGYDWLHSDLSLEDRRIIREALLDKALRTSFEHDGWVQNTSNWGQVCHAGMAAAALALLEDHPEIATRVVHRAVTQVTHSTQAYAPNGTYPEGPGYWAYGTTYNVILIAALQSALGTDFSLAHEPGFEQTAAYLNHATGPTLQYFNYSDGHAARHPLPALHWFASYFQRPDWLVFEQQILNWYLYSTRALEVEDHAERMLPLALIWMPESTDGNGMQRELHWLGEGETPVALHRTSWTDPDAIFFGIKAGSPSSSHGQMDTGSFVLEADGVRWAVDLGAENYHRIESRGMDLWGREQDSDRWRIFRNNNHSHNTLVIGDRLQIASGHATILEHSDAPEFPFSIVDLSPVYQGQATRVLRGIGLIGGAAVLVQDQIEGAAGEPVRWGMVTGAEVEVRGSNEAVLRQNGKELVMRVISPVNARLRIFETANPPAEHDSPNPGTRMIGFSVDAPHEERLDLAVLLTPGSRTADAPRTVSVKPLQEW